eukprot:13248037-Alexandrium_andersonii.AAC.1
MPPPDHPLLPLFCFTAGRPSYVPWAGTVLHQPTPTLAEAGLLRGCDWAWTPATTPLVRGGGAKWG